ncbi:MAG: ECF transporter S component [Longicatena sp.]
MSAYVSTKSRLDVHSIAKISILGALACILMMFQFPLPFAPAFYQLDFSEVVVLIGGFALGPWAAVCIEALKIVLNLLLNGSATMGVGELGNFIIGCALVLPPVILYKKEKTKKHAIVGLLIGTILMSIVGAIVNYFVLLPAYAFFMQPYLTIDMIIGMGHAINSNINSLLPLVLICVVPFNIVKGIMVSAVVMLTYKKIAPVLKKL